MSSSSAPQLEPTGNAAPKLAQFAETQSFKLTEPPNVGWKVGDGLSDTQLGRDWKSDEELGWKTWDMAQTSPSDATQILNSTVVPRPIAFVSTLSAENKPNLAPFRYGTRHVGFVYRSDSLAAQSMYLPSFFQVVAYHPPIVSVSFRLAPRIPKNTRDNILATKEFVVNLISEPFVEAANETSVEAPADVSEWDISGLTQEPSVHIKPARVKESAVSLECELFQSQDIFPDGATVPSATLVLGRVKYIHVRNTVLRSDGLRADPAMLRAVSRLGSKTYGRLGEGFELKKPEWDEVRPQLSSRE